MNQSLSEKGFGWNSRPKAAKGVEHRSYSCVEDNLEQGKTKGAEVKKDSEPENHLEFWFNFPNKKVRAIETRAILDSRHSWQVKSVGFGD